MPRLETTSLDQDFLYDRWRIFGAWLRSRRRMTGKTQAEAAEAAGISRRQWIRYEQGAKMLRKRVERVARIINVPLETMLERAGYKASRRMNDVKGRLDKISDMLFAGTTYMAIVELLRLNDRIILNRNGVGQIRGGPEAVEFCRVIRSVNALPARLYELLWKVMEEMSKDKKKEPRMDPRERNRLERKCIEALRGKSLS
jgi:transcriptional regulator with XRE-family HTH domain